MIATERRDQTASVCMAVDRRYGRSGVGEEAQIGGAIGIGCHAAISAMRISRSPMRRSRH
jgi:hypothetical protein